MQYLILASEEVKFCVAEPCLIGSGQQGQGAGEPPMMALAPAGGTAAPPVGKIAAAIVPCS